MKISKEVILKIELVGDEVLHLKDALGNIMAAENASSLGIGFLKPEQKKILQSILNEINKGNA
ncbi:hypothetical protein [Flavobacterium sp. UMI-01]|uniref:hypothetical protein n=1 Tax=Flavobacterium sp. UMI-01 TaxID=1441053 RepID=UPI001C7D8480|nr:hypothetical protein [Flavobacterium sp. UMI-01]GIZ08328.1 hypothetical protein FUMI01_10550 [Flavobacterium sp. UMI-01]